MEKKVVIFQTVIMKPDDKTPSIIQTYEKKVCNCYSESYIQKESSAY